VSEAPDWSSPQCTTQNDEAFAPTRRWAAGCSFIGLTLHGVMIASASCNVALLCVLAVPGLGQGVDGEDLSRPEARSVETAGQSAA
jgi:hypothetical protein